MVRSALRTHTGIKINNMDFIAGGVYIDGADYFEKPVP